MNDFTKAVTQAVQVTVTQLDPTKANLLILTLPDSMELTQHEASLLQRRLSCLGIKAVLALPEGASVQCVEARQWSANYTDSVQTIERQLTQRYTH